jgi:hypothetical protein
MINEDQVTGRARVLAYIIVSLVSLPAWFEIAAADIIGITSISASDAFYWTSYIGNGQPTAIPSPLNITSSGGNTATLTVAGGSVSFWSEGGNFLGNFYNGTVVLYNNNGGPDTIVLANPVQAIGAHIDWNTMEILQRK